MVDTVGHASDERVVTRKVVDSSPYMGELRLWWYACSACGSPVDVGDAECPRCGAVFGEPVEDKGFTQV